MPNPKGTIYIPHFPTLLSMDDKGAEKTPLLVLPGGANTPATDNHMKFTITNAPLYKSVPYVVASPFIGFVGVCCAVWCQEFDLLSECCEFYYCM